MIRVGGGITIDCHLHLFGANTTPNLCFGYCGVIFIHLLFRQSASSNSVMLIARTSLLLGETVIDFTADILTCHSRESTGVLMMAQFH